MIYRVWVRKMAKLAVELIDGCMGYFEGKVLISSIAVDEDDSKTNL